MNITIITMGISREAKKLEPSETISQESREQALPKRQAPQWGEDIVRTAWKRAAVLIRHGRYVANSDEHIENS